MTLHGDRGTIGVRELHDRLSEHLQRVQAGGEITVTRRGRPIARLTAFDVDDPLDDLVRDGLVTAPRMPRRTDPPRVIADGTVSDLVADQRR
jgi:prevent-host-death family protein